VCVLKYGSSSSVDSVDSVDSVVYMPSVCYRMIRVRVSVRDFRFVVVFLILRPEHDQCYSYVDSLNTAVRTPSLS